LWLGVRAGPSGGHSLRPAPRRTARCWGAGMTTKGKSLADLTARVDAAAAARPISPPAPTVEPTSPHEPGTAAEPIAPIPNPPARPAQAPPVRPASIPSPFSMPHRTRRYTAELPDAIHLKLKEFVLNERTTAYAVNYALV